MAGTTINPYRFGGQVGYRRDSPSRQYVRARHLDVGQGRWASRDPIGFRGADANLYRYVSNHPVVSLDPTGKDPQWTTPHCKIADLLRRATIKACQAARSCGRPPLSGTIKFCLTNFCNNVEEWGLGEPIHCGFPECRSDPTLCASSDSFWGFLGVCPDNLLSPRCGCKGYQLDPVTQAALSILHEMMHFCDVADFEYEKCLRPSSGTNPAHRLASECLGLHCNKPGYLPAPVFG